MSVQNNVGDARTRIARNADQLAAAGRITPQELATLKDNKVTREDFAIARKIQGNLIRDLQAGGGTYRAHALMFRSASAVQEDLIDAAGLKPRLHELVKQEMGTQQGGIGGALAAYGRALETVLRDLPAK